MTGSDPYLVEAEFELRYEGPGVDAGTMAVSDLAPALLALERLFADVASHENPLLEAPSLRVTRVAQGSFVVVLLLHASDAWTYGVEAMNSNEANAVGNLIGVVGGIGGLFAWLKALRNRNAEPVSEVKSDALPPEGLQLEEDLAAGRQDMVDVLMSDGTIEQVSRPVYDAFIRPTTKKLANEVVEPLRSEDVERMSFIRGGETTVSVSRDDLPAFGTGIAQSDIAIDVATGTAIESEQEMFVEIYSVDFGGDKKWRVGDAGSRFTVSIEDHDFITSVEQGDVAFMSGDILHCRIRTTQEKKGSRVMSDRVITEVIEHIHAGDPGQLLP